MNAALERRLTKLEDRQTDDLIIRVERSYVPFPEVDVQWVTAATDPDNHGQDAAGNMSDG